VNDVHFLVLEDLLHLTRGLGAGPVRDVGLLDSAVARSRSSAFGEDAYPTIELKAAALLHSMSSNLALVDGNKRLSWLATTVFLGLNGFAVVLDHDVAFDLVMRVAEGVADVEQIAEVLGRGIRSSQ